MWALKITDVVLQKLRSQGVGLTSLNGCSSTMLGHSLHFLVCTHLP